MNLKALTVAVFLATISYSFSAINNSTVYTNEPSKSPAADTRTNSATQQNGNHTNSPTKKTTEPFTEAASKQTTTKLIVPKSKPTKGTQVNNTRLYTPAPSQKTKPSTKPTTTNKKTNTATKPITTPQPTTTPKPEITCEMRNESCSVCLKDSSCFYCDSDNTCKMKKKGKILPSGCKGNKWYWKQCKILGKFSLIFKMSFVLLFVFWLSGYVMCSQIVGIPPPPGCAAFA